MNTQKIPNKKQFYKLLRRNSTRKIILEKKEKEEDINDSKKKFKNILDFKTDLSKKEHKICKKMDVLNSIIFHSRNKIINKGKLNLYNRLKDGYINNIPEIMIGLNELGFGAALAMRIFQVYKDETLEIIQSNPYRLVEDVEGIGFSRADELGSKLGIQGNHPDRIKAACLYKLDADCMQEGHCYLEKSEFVFSVKQMLESTQPIEIPLEDREAEL